MAQYKRVAIAGATGNNLGPSLLKGLIDAGFEVTVLSRSESLDSSVKTVKVDYNSHESLVAALKGCDAVVSNLPNHDGQKPLIDAAITAGVKRFLPSEFGLDAFGDPQLGALPLFRDGKSMIHQHLVSKGDAITWTLVTTGPFLDWGLRGGSRTVLINLQGKTQLFDGGSKPFSAALLSDISKAVVGVLQHPLETKNRAVYVQSALVSQNKLLDIARKVRPTFTGEVEAVSTEQVAQDAQNLLAEGKNFDTAMFKFILFGIYGKQFGGDWAHNNDNKLLGIDSLTDLELEKVVESCF